MSGQKKPRKPFNKASAWARIKTTLVGGMVEQQDAGTHSEIVLPAYAALDALSHGRLDGDGFILMVEMNTAAFCIASRLYAQGSDAVKAAMSAHKAPLENAADALASVGDRYKRTRKFGASGDELAKVRASIVLLDKLSGAVPKGLLLKALLDAAKMTQERLRKIEAA